MGNLVTAAGTALIPASDVQHGRLPREWEIMVAVNHRLRQAEDLDDRGSWCDNVFLERLEEALTRHGNP